MTKRFTIVIERDGWWWRGYSPELPGCEVRASSLRKARELVEKAIRKLLSRGQD